MAWCQTMTQHEYNKYRLDKWISFAKFCITLSALIALMILAPNQATQFASYIGTFLFGVSKAKNIAGL